MSNKAPSQNIGAALYLRLDKQPIFSRLYKTIKRIDRYDTGFTATAPIIGGYHPRKSASGILTH